MARPTARQEVAMADSGRRARPARGAVSSAAFAGLERSPDNRAMFSPTQDDVRGFFVEAGRKRRERLPLTPLETLAADWIEAHPEYAADLADVETARAAAYPAEGSRENPFLHLSMHLSISEQVAIDQPVGIRPAYESLVARLGSAHAAQHEVMECLGTMLWEAQRAGRPPDGAAYVDCVRRRASR
jgi:uncharacterized protein DUF1841